MVNIYNIPSNYHFFNSFLLWLDSGFAEKISEVKIFFPNRRAVREFQQAFLDKFSSEVKPPKCKAIADISYEDFLDSFPKNQIQPILDELSKVKCLEGFDHLFFLSREIIKTKVFAENLNFSRALSIATQLKNLFDDIEREEIDLNLLHQIDDSDLAAHRQFTLDFLKKFYLRIKNSILKNDVISAVSYQNLIIGKLGECAAKYGLKSPLIIAGSTGSINYSKKFIKSVAADKNGYVVLYGLNQASIAVDDETHPQFILNELLKFLSVEKKQVKEIKFEQYKICDDDRVSFLASMMLPSQETHRWQALSSKLDTKEIAQDLEENFFYLEAKNEIEEARIIAVTASQALQKNHKVAIIANDHKFCELLKAQFRDFSLSFNDARSLDLSSSKLVNLILLLLELIENDFDSVTLLAILKSCRDNAGKVPALIYSDFEIKILREQRSGKGLQSIKNKLKTADENLQKFFDDFLQKLTRLMNIGFESDLSQYIEAIISTVENLTEKKWEDLIALEPASEELAQLFEKLKSLQGFFILRKDALQFFQHLFAQIKYFDKEQKAASIHILSTLEARLLNFDVIIISSLNQNDFPQTEGENWLGRKLRKELGIDSSAKKYGQNAYDFCNYLSNKEVVMTRCQTKGGALTIASPFILRFEILCKKLNYKVSARHPETGGGAYNIAESKTLTSAKPKKEFRPKKLAITDIAKLMSDPYQIYAKRILQLRELNKIDYEPEFREFGSFVHQALEEYIKNPAQDNFIQNAQRIFAKFFQNEEAQLIWWPKFENIFKNFILENNALESVKDYVEVPVKLFIKDVFLTGKIDRISFSKNDEAAIYDYKTGQIPSKTDVLCGLQPQLTIAALMLMLGVIENKNLQTPQKISSLNYWKISATNESEIKPIFKSAQEVAIAVNAAKAGLEKLIEYYSDENNAYESAMDIDYKHEYSHLARVF